LAPSTGVENVALDLAWISLLALLVTIVVSCTTSVNPGFLGIALAWVIGVYVAPCFGQSIGVKGVVAGFPTELFVTLAGVTLLFTLAQENGTLERVAQRAVLSCRGIVGLVPVMFFLLALGLATIGAGNIAAAALVAPMAMTVAKRAGIPALLMTIMVAHGAMAGALSPFSPTGIIARGLMSRMGLADFEWPLFFNNLLANAAVALCGYFLFGGWRLFGRTYGNGESGTLELDQAPQHRGTGLAQRVPDGAGPAGRFQFGHWFTLGTIAVLITSVIAFRVDVGMGAFAGSVVLVLLRMANERKAVQGMPWSVIMMVCGVTVLTSLLGKTGGMDRVTELVARIANPQTVTGLIALVAGLVSVYSSTSGVVLPAFLPMTPGLVVELGGGDPLAIASSIAVGGHLVDVSPLSTIGALCVACAAVEEDRRMLFNKVLAWGLSMSLVGALYCYVVFGLW
jgi:di/tricarboxylate transporter